MRPEHRAHTKATMPKLIALRDFSYFHRGYQRVDYVAGSEIETDDQEMIEVAIDQRWAYRADQPEAANSGPAKRGRKQKSKE